MANVLRVRNVAQKVLWEEELAGQISDGQWENAGPLDHWQPWTDAEVIVDPDNVGRDFYARKDNYNFVNADLLECVGDRMLKYVQAAVDPNYTMADMRRDLADLKKIVRARVAADLPVPPQPVGHPVPNPEYAERNPGLANQYPITGYAEPVVATVAPGTVEFKDHSGRMLTGVLAGRVTHPQTGAPLAVVLRSTPSEHFVVVPEANVVGFEVAS